MSKQSMREEAERLIRETMEKRNLVVKQGNTRIEAVCGKCGAPNRLSAAKGTTPREIYLQGMRAQAGNAVGGRCRMAPACIALARISEQTLIEP